MRAQNLRRLLWVIDDSHLDAERARAALCETYEVEVFHDGEHWTACREKGADQRSDLFEIERVGRIARLVSLDEKPNLFARGAEFDPPLLGIDEPPVQRAQVADRGGARRDERDQAAGLSFRRAVTKQP